MDEQDEILADFLLEGGETLESLQEQLVSLESAGDDTDLLNAIFRGFHTIKGGAGFLQLDPLVTICHRTENLFDQLRSGQQTLTSEMMDSVLASVDCLVEMFDSLRDSQPLSEPPADLISDLDALCNPDATPTEPAASVDAETSEPSAQSHDNSGDSVELFGESEGDTGGIDLFDDLGFDDSQPTHHLTQEQFDSMLASWQIDATSDQGSAGGTASSTDSELITDDEFDALLDELHGSGKGPTAAAEVALAPTDVLEPPTSESDEITDDEFDALLDQLHGEGKGPTVAPVTQKASEKTVSEASPKKDSTPEKPKVEPKKASEPKLVQAESTVRVDTQRLDNIMNMVGELVLVRNRLMTLGNQINNESMAKAVGNLDVVTVDLQASVMKTRMQPIKKVFGRFPRVVRDLARSLSKEVNLELVGEETDLDKNLVEALADPLVHLVRNSVDHGIEMPKDREDAGKPRMGTVKLTAEQEGDHILLTIKDDGKGMDPDMILSKAVEKGVLDADSAARLAPKDIYNLIFEAGFSTRDEVNDISGRGVGMDVVKTTINQLNGTIDIDSSLGEGSTIIIRVPLTLAIMPTLMFKVGEQAFAFPLVSVNEIFQLNEAAVHRVDGQDVVTIRNRSIPLFFLDRWLVNEGKTEIDQQCEAHIVIVTVGNSQVGFVVDYLIGQEEVVIKPLGAMLHGTPGMAGATITGDGRIALILDVPSMLKQYAA